jgi:hypothetical protein
MINDNNNTFKNYIDENLIVDTKRKKILGEVMTPTDLIEQMLDTLPSSVWTNPSLKWLEPTCGSGHFMICIFKRLVKHFDACHIIQNMLYMIDINEENVAKCRSVFGEEANIYCADILTYKEGLFDIIVGNVPFQQTSLLGGKSKLYEKITTHCLTLLSDGGFMSFIVPDNLFSGGNKTYKELIRHQIHVLNLCKSNQLYFPKIQQFICYFLMEKRFIATTATATAATATEATTTKIICNNGETMNILLFNRPINPVRDWNPKTEQLTTRHISLSRNAAVYVRGLPLSEYVGEKYKVIYTPSAWLTTDSESIPGLGIKKIVIFSISIDFKFTIDWNGEFGVGPNTFYIPIENEADGLVWKQFLESSDYRVLASACRTCRQFLKNAFVSGLLF